MAQQEGFEAVTTTLLYSKYQRHDDIATRGEQLAQNYGIPFLYRDFREGWKEGQIHGAFELIYDLRKFISEQYHAIILSFILNLLVRPVVGDLNVMEFHRAGEAIEAGYKATREAIAKAGL